jgi:hypothetical protein
MITNNKVYLKVKATNQLLATYIVEVAVSTVHVDAGVVARRSADCEDVVLSLQYHFRAINRQSSRFRRCDRYTGQRRAHRAAARQFSND